MRLLALTTAVLLLGILSASGPPPRAAPAPEPSALLERGVQSFNLGRFRRSMALLRRALRRATDTAVQAKIHLYLGMNHVVMRQHARAEDAFKEALKRDPSLSLDPAQTKEAILSLFRQVREALKGKLEIRADRPGAIVKIDGKELGSAPFTGELTVGKHEVSVVAKELGQLFDPYEESILVHVGRTHTVEAKLKAHSGLLKVTSRPPGASVAIDGEERGTTPSGIVLAAGSHLVRLALEGHKPQSEQVQVEAGVVRPLEVALDPLPPPKPPPIRVVKEKEIEPPKKAGRLWTWVVAGGAVAAAGAGLGFGLWARSDWEDYQDAAMAGDRARYDESRDSGQSHATAANVFFITAGVLAATAAVLYLFVERPPESESSSARPVLGAWRW